MEPVNLEKMDYENGCRELVSKVCSSVRGVVGASFDGTYYKLEEFRNNDESNQLEGYSGFIVDFPTSKAVVDYVDERVVQEMAAIDVGVESVNGKTGAVTISASDVGAATQTDIDNSVEVFEDYISSIYVKKTYSVNNTTFNITYSDTPALNLTAQNSSQVNGIGISTSGLSIGVTNLSNGVSTGITIQNNNVSIGAPNGSVIIQNVTTPTNNTDAVNKSYVDTVIPKVYSSTNTGGYLTMATLPKYDGTVV